MKSTILIALAAVFMLTIGCSKPDNSASGDRCDRIEPKIEDIRLSYRNYMKANPELFGTFNVWLWPDSILTMRNDISFYHNSCR